MRHALVPTLVLVLAVATGCARSDAAPVPPPLPLADAAPVPPGTERAVFAGGCFWSMEKAFESVRGVQRAVSGYTGGTTANPTYESMHTRPAGHVEAVEVVFDPNVVSYETLVRFFWHNVDPTRADGQFCDGGPVYRAAIFPTDAAQRRVAEASLRAVRARMTRPVVAQIRPAARFWPAEDYHQDFARLNPERYEQYRRGCRRDLRLRALWGDDAGVAGRRI